MNETTKRYGMKQIVRGMESWYDLRQEADGDYVEYAELEARDRKIAELEDDNIDFAACRTVLKKQIAALERELGECRKDAQRYRWLKSEQCNSLHLSRNADHACNYVTAKEWIEDYQPEWFEEDAPSEIQRMKDTDTIWTLQIYPNTPIGFNAWNAATLDSVVDAAIDAALSKVTHE